MSQDTELVVIYTLVSISTTSWTGRSTQLSGETHVLSAQSCLQQYAGEILSVLEMQKISTNLSRRQDMSWAALWTVLGNGGTDTQKCHIYSGQYAACPSCDSFSFTVERRYTRLFAPAEITLYGKRHYLY